MASRMPPPPQQESPLRVAKTNTAASIMILSCQKNHTGHLPPCPLGLLSLAAVRTGGRGPVPDGDCSPTATPCGSFFLDESSANGNDSICSSMSGIPLGDKGLVNSPHFSKNNYIMACQQTET
jgi:hypothetical protein